MKRPIKFRFFYDDKKITGLSAKMYSGLPSSCLETVMEKDGMHKTEILFAPKGSEHLGGWFSIMQFTGLLDKNGKEIWEDDVVRCWDVLDSSKEFFRKVEWSAGGFIANGSLGVNNHTLEVIGNIHKNPELL